jgi:hypothetical protein
MRCVLYFFILYDRIVVSDDMPRLSMRSAVVEEKYTSLATRVGLFTCALGILCPLGLIGTMTCTEAHTSKPPVIERSRTAVCFSDPLSSGFFSTSGEQPMLTAEQIEKALVAVNTPTFSDSDFPAAGSRELGSTVCACACSCQCVCTYGPGQACNCSVCNCDCNCGACPAVCACGCACTVGPCYCCGGKHGAGSLQTIPSMFRV